MKTPTSSDTGDDLQARTTELFDNIQGLLDDAEAHVRMREVDSLKGGCWKFAVGWLVAKYGIKDETTLGMIVEELRSALAKEGFPSESCAPLQDAIMEFRSEYREMISWV